MNLFKSIKSAIVEAYAVMCLSVNPTVQATETVVSVVVSEASATTIDASTAAEAVKGALATADEAANHSDTWEGYQEYCASVQRLFAAEDAMLEAAGLTISVAAGVLVSSPAGKLVSTATIVEPIEVSGTLVSSLAGALVSTAQPTAEVGTPASEALLEIEAEVMEVYSVPVAPAPAIVYEEEYTETVLDMVEGGNYFLAIEENRVLVQEMLAQQEKEVQSKVRWAQAKAAAKIKMADRKAIAIAKAQAEVDAAKTKADTLNATPEAIAGKQSYAAALAWVSALEAEIKNAYDFCEVNMSNDGAFKQGLEALEYARYKLEAAEVVLASYS